MLHTLWRRRRRGYRTLGLSRRRIVTLESLGLTCIVVRLAVDRSGSKPMTVAGRCRCQCRWQTNVGAACCWSWKWVKINGGRWVVLAPLWPPLSRVLVPVHWYCWGCRGSSNCSQVLVKVALCGVDVLSCQLCSCSWKLTISLVWRSRCLVSCIES